VTHLHDVARATEHLRSFPAAVAAICRHAAQRRATWVEIEFADALIVRDDGLQINAIRRGLIAMLSDGTVDLDTAIGTRGELELFGFVHHVDAARFYTWRNTGADLSAQTIGVSRSHKVPGIGPLAWNDCPVPPAPNTPPAHGATIRWDTLPASAPAANDAFAAIRREMRALLDPAVADLVRLRIASLHGTRPLD